jgi:hypothetical protein
MKCIGFISILLIFYVNSLQAEIKNYDVSGDTAIYPNKDQIANALINLRDSIDNSVLDLEKKREGNRVNYRLQYGDVYKQILLQRGEIEQLIEEVVTTSEYSWDERATVSNLNQIRQRRKEYYQTLKDIKDIADSKHASK